MKALVIGGTNYACGYLVDYLVEEFGYEVAVTKEADDNINITNAKIYDMNIMDIEQIKVVLNDFRPDYIFNLESQNSVALSWENPGLTIDVNIKGNLNILDMVRELDYKPRLLLVGAGEEYGHVINKESISEEDNTRPENIYAATKVCQNMISNIYAEAYEMDVVMARTFNHVGPNQKSVFVISDFCKQVAEIEKGEKDPFIYVGNLSAKRDFTDVRDIVKAYALLVKFGQRGETYNVGSGQAVSIKEILNKVLSMSKVNIDIKVDPEKIRPVDVPVIQADVQKIYNCTGWKPQISLDETIKETLDYWRKEI